MGLILLALSMNYYFPKVIILVVSLESSKLVTLNKSIGEELNKNDFPS